MTARLAGAVRSAALAFLLILVACAPAFAAPEFPRLTGRVVDQANLLSPAEEAELTAKLEGLESRTTDQLVVVTVPSLGDYAIEDYGYQLGRHWRIGQAGKNNGVLLIVAPNERKVRIEVGYGLEGVLTDALSSVIIHERILPRFRDDDYPGGIRSGVDAIVEQLTIDRGEAERRAAAAADRSHDDMPVGLLIFLLIIFLFVVPALLAALGGGRRRGRDGGWVWTGGGGGWSSGGSSFGGFSGGGGSFGGGGASGGW